MVNSPHRLLGLYTVVSQSSHPPQNMRSGYSPNYSLYLNLVLLIWLTATFAIAIPERILAPLRIYTSEPRVTSDVPRHLTNAPSNSLQKRTGLIRLNNGWLGRLENFDIILPAPIASTTFALFYEKIMIGVTNMWLHDPQASSLRISMDQLTLQMTSTQQISIPWNVVYHFAMAMREATTRGFPGRYVGYFTHPTLPFDVGVHVVLGISQVASAA